MEFHSIDVSDIMLCENEASSRLRVPRDFDRAYLSEIENKLKKSIDCKMSWTRIPTSDISIMLTESADLARCIGDSKEVFVFAVTLGTAVDRYLLSLSKTSVSGHFSADALASAYADGAADSAQDYLNTIAKTKKRFSPGYGDLSLIFQKRILDLVGGEKILGIILTDELLMKPQKTITAIVGIENEK